MVTKIIVFSFSTFQEEFLKMSVSMSIVMWWAMSAVHLSHHEELERPLRLIIPLSHSRLIFQQKKLFTHIICYIMAKRAIQGSKRAHDILLTSLASLTRQTTTTRIYDRQRARYFLLSRLGPET